MRRVLLTILVGLAAGLGSGPATAQLFFIERDSPDVIGEVSLTHTVYSDTLSDLARAYDQGYEEMRQANPKVDPWLPGAGTEVVVPTLYVLPDAPRVGIVVNVPEMRIYFYKPTPRGQPQAVYTFPIGVGRQDWTTPKAITQVVGKVKDPAWYPPASIRKEHAAEGDPLPMVVPGGPDNPLGTHALQLGLKGYLIHGTNKPYGIGMRVTHGCVRLYNNDIDLMFKEVRVGTPVRIVNQPYKVGVGRGQVYLEVHPHLVEDKAQYADEYLHVVRLIVDRVKNYRVQLVWSEIRRALREKSGVPQPIGTYWPKTAEEVRETAEKPAAESRG